MNYPDTPPRLVLPLKVVACEFEGEARQGAVNDVSSLGHLQIEKKIL